MDLQSSFYDEDLVNLCEEVELLNQKSNGYSPASQPLNLGWITNPLLWELEEDQDTEIDNIEIEMPFLDNSFLGFSDDVYEPTIHCDSCWSSEYSME
jgi:hypothetical protein